MIFRGVRQDLRAAFAHSAVDLFRAQFARAFEKQVLDKMINARRFVRAEGQYDGEGYAVQPLVLRGEHRGAVG